MSEVNSLTRSPFSDEVESRVLGFKVTMRLRWFLSSASSFSNQCSQSVSIPDGWGLLDRPGNIVVGVAQLVGQELELIWWSSNGVIDNGVASGGWETLLGSSRHEEELVDVFVSDLGINDCARHWVLERSHITAKDPGVDTLANIDVHELCVTQTKTG